MNLIMNFWIAVCVKLGLLKSMSRRRHKSWNHAILFTTFYHFLEFEVFGKSKSLMVMFLPIHLSAWKDEDITGWNLSSSLTVSLPLHNFTWLFSKKNSLTVFFSSS